jgi:MFS family permease
VPRQWTTLAAAAGVATAGVLPVFLTGALAVQVREELGFDEAGQGLTVAAFFGTAALSSALAGRVSERLGPASSMRVSAAVSAVSLLSVAVVARSLPLLLACLVVGGLGNAMAQPATNLFLARRVPPSRLGLAFGVKQSAIPMATLLGGLAVPSIALTVGWRWAYVLGAAAAALLVVIDVGGATTAPTTERGARRGERDTALRPLLLLAVGVGLGAAAAGTLGSFLVSGAVEEGLAEGTAGLLASACSAAGVATRLVSGVRADRRGGRHLPVVAGMMASGSVGFTLLAVGTAPAIVAGALLAYVLGWSWPGLFNLAIVRSNPGAPGAATGITQTGTYIGGVLGPLLFGAAVSRTGYPPAWLAAGGAALVGSVMIVLGRRALMADRMRREALAPV